MYTHVMFSVGPMCYRYFSGHAACGLGVLMCCSTADCDVINLVDLQHLQDMQQRAMGEE